MLTQSSAGWRAKLWEMYCKVTREESPRIACGMTRDAARWPSRNGVKTYPLKAKGETLDVALKYFP